MFKPNPKGYSVGVDASLGAVIPLMSEESISLPDKALREIVARHYFIPDAIVRIGSEAGDTFRLSAQSGSFILKISAQASAQADYAFQSELLRFLNGRGVEFVASVISTKEGRAMFEAPYGESAVYGYLQSEVCGPMLNGICGADKALACQLAETLAALTNNLSDFRHWAEGRSMIWNIRTWPRFAELGIDPGRDASHVLRGAREILLDFADRDFSRLADLPWQVIHNDASPFNVIARADGNGLSLIDFGDAGWAPRVLEIATAMTHLLGAEQDGARLSSAMLLSYSEHVVLSDAELAAIPMLMRARCAFVLLLNAWRTCMFPEQADYINKSTARCVRCLDALTTQEIF